MQNAGIIISPSTEQKIRGRNAALRLMNKSPKFRDVLRQRFRHRIKENRSNFMNQLRKLDSSEDVSEALTSVLREEISQIIHLKDDSKQEEIEALKLEEQIVMEQLTDEETWWMTQYENLFANEENLQLLFDENSLIICPICLKGNLQHQYSQGVIVCSNCCIGIPARASLEEIHSQICRCLDVHDNSRCTKDIQFFMSSELGTSYLYVICEHCSYLDIIV